jgi:hypothetical protein
MTANKRPIVENIHGDFPAQSSIDRGGWGGAHSLFCVLF